MATRIGIILVVLAVTVAAPIFWVDSGADISIWVLSSISLLVIGMFFFTSRLLERFAPAEPEDQRTYFNAKKPGAPGPKIADIERSNRKVAEASTPQAMPTNTDSPKRPRRAA